MDIKTLEKMLDGPRDNAMLRLTLARQLLNNQQIEAAIAHLQVALDQQKNYSAAWKLLAQCYQQTGQIEQATQAYRQGLEVARENGDKQSEKEMQVFLRRLNKTAPQQ